MKDFETPEVLTEQDIQMIIRDYKIAAQYAKDAGFDGVELHAAMGFLPNQFLMESSNQRDDQYGGSFENRSRFIVETMQALIEIFGKQRVGIRLSPSILLHDMHDRNPVGLYTHLIGSLDKLPIAYFHLIQPLFPLDKDSVYPHDVLLEFGDLITSDIIVNGGYTKEKAEMEIETGRSQFVSFGSLFLANPDLVRRFKENSIINSPDKETMYSGGDEKGYTDYPFLYEDSTH
ncbi:N-ethylmaleimide reductase [compost metagenome]